MHVPLPARYSSTEILALCIPVSPPFPSWLHSSTAQHPCSCAKTTASPDKRASATLSTAVKRVAERPRPTHTKTLKLFLWKIIVTCYFKNKITIYIPCESLGHVNLRTIIAHDNFLKTFLRPSIKVRRCLTKPNNVIYFTVTFSRLSEESKMNTCSSPNAGRFFLWLVNLKGLPARHPSKRSKKKKKKDNHAITLATALQTVSC